MNISLPARELFPILEHQINGRPLIYLDNAATTQKPLPVLDASRSYYESMNANIHRGTHALARAATEAYEAARKTVAAHLGAADAEELIFTSGCTDGINLAAQVLSSRLSPGDEIIISTLEHHSNIVPWQMACERTGAILRVIPCDESGVLDLAAYDQLLNERTKVVSVGWISNAFGTRHPVKEIVRRAKSFDAVVVIDAAQAIPHLAIDVHDLGCDMLAFSGHKVYAPTGIGALWGKRSLLESLPPYRGGGEMIKEVSFAGTTYNDIPFKYEAGTPNIEGAIALAAAIQFVQKVGLAAIQSHETTLIRAAEKELQAIDGIHLYGPSDRIGALSFRIEGVHAYDLGTFLDQMGVAVRTGHHCCQPLMARFGITGTIRASFALYNTLEEIAQFGESTRRAVKMLR
ncbi:MAG: cysteine desulfurase [Verrucomicrobia bacterium]|nr:MAG: cysteine desulfurase [Verrucomicrobiota bacterium]